ncbi:NAD(P)/FAD-dependent oxidoreductase [Zunongwangia sp. HRR-M8]|uniref:NAD(P)/FAD-dependent oxidoreductase n=1 Tax=Zunongwangia sp. HRR-M8 TaxID=3015170 RepID=UPI0022DD926A|nr:FAD-dependent oxidoreductase [Zunongwangia sp. HRR-M8]WBL22275.1 FAD-dependent oxidoreductase [Zunongwangia sp. HRR-M8]
MNFSYWEQKSWLSDLDFVIVGSGITGLNCALQLHKDYPGSNILILEKGLLPEGASTKNAGFVCFGSLSEILEDLKMLPEEDVVALIQKRLNGLKLLRKNFGDDEIGFKNHGGYEVFLEKDKNLFEECVAEITNINRLLYEVFESNCFSLSDNKFNFKNTTEKLIFSPFESQIDTGKMMTQLLRKVYKKGIRILNNIAVQNFEDLGNKVVVKTSNFELECRKLFIATNGFASKFGISQVKPARAQVLVTKPIENLQIKGTFHLDKGFYYFRNINNRILFGGGRNLDKKGEETIQFGQTEIIQQKLEELLKTSILPNQKVEIDQRWSGIMGVGINKKPEIGHLSDNVFYGVKLGGMGISIGSLVGKELAKVSE